MNQNNRIRDSTQ